LPSALRCVRAASLYGPSAMPTFATTSPRFGYRHWSSMATPTSRRRWDCAAGRLLRASQSMRAAGMACRWLAAPRTDSPENCWRSPAWREIAHPTRPARGWPWCGDTEDCSEASLHTAAFGRHSAKTAHGIYAWSNVALPGPLDQCDHECAAHLSPVVVRDQQVLVANCGELGGPKVRGWEACPRWCQRRSG
jgi:hypothetical protein